MDGRATINIDNISTLHTWFEASPYSNPFQPMLVIVMSNFILLSRSSSSQINMPDSLLCSGQFFRREDRNVISGAGGIVVISLLSFRTSPCPWPWRTDMLPPIKVVSSLLRSSSTVINHTRVFFCVTTLQNVSEYYSNDGTRVKFVSVTNMRWVRHAKHLDVFYSELIYMSVIIKMRSKDTLFVEVEAWTLYVA